MREKYYAGFMTDIPSWYKGLRVVRRRITAFAMDLLVLGYLWTMVAFCVNMLAFHEKSFVILDWRIMLIVCVEAAVLWESFGVSIGMRLLDLRIADGSERSLTMRLVARFARFVLWHVSALPIFGLLIANDGGRRGWHDRVAGLRMVKADDSARQGGEKTPWYRRSWIVAVAVVVSVTLVAAGLFTKVDIPTLIRRAPSTGKIWRQLLTPDWSLFVKGFRYLIITIFTAFVATFFAILLAAPLSFLAARNLVRGFLGRCVYTLIRAVMSIIRSIEPIVWGIIFIVWVRVGAFPGVLALFVHSVADLTKLYSERLESIDPGPVEALTATGASRLHVILYGIVPQIINPYLSFTIYRWDINVRMATVIGLIGVPVIGQLLYQYTQLSQYHKVGMMMLLILATVWIMDYTSARLRARLE
jgi:phosphonate transport system permease protein